MDLFKNFKIMQNKYKKSEYYYCPDTFLLPEESTKFQSHLAKLKEDPKNNPNKLWIVKPNTLIKLITLKSYLFIFNKKQLKN